MGKNNKLINSVKRMAEKNRERNTLDAANQIIPAVYASLAIALHESSLDADSIEYLFGRSQAIWTRHRGNLREMVKQCEELTGIEVRFRDEYAS